MPAFLPACLLITHLQREVNEAAAATAVYTTPSSITQPPPVYSTNLGHDIEAGQHVGVADEGEGGAAALDHVLHFDAELVSEVAEDGKGG